MCLQMSGVYLEISDTLIISERIQGCSSPCRYPRTEPQTSSDADLDWPRTAPRDDDENLEDDPERSDTKDNPCESHVNLPKVARQRAAEQQERKLQYHWQGLHYMVKVPGNDPFQLPLAILAAFYYTPPHAGRCISIQPLLAQHREEGGKD